MSKAKIYTKKEIQDILPLSFTQKMMLISALKDTECKCNYEQCHYVLEGEIYEDIIEQAWKTVIQCNDTLRGVFVWEQVRTPLFVIYKEYYGLIQVQNLCGEYEEFSYVEKIRQERWQQKVRLDQNPFRVTLLKTRKDRLHLILDSHHCIMDGWSNALILKEFVQVYCALCRGQNFRLPEYRLREFVQGPGKTDTERAKRFWENYLSGYEFASFKPEREIVERHYYQLKISEEMYERILQYTQYRKILLSAIFYGAWALVEKQINSKSDYIFGVAFSGRNPLLKNMEHAVGLFVNTVPLRIRYHPDCKEYINQINSDLITISSHQHVSFGELSLNMDRNAQSLFQTVIAIQNYPIDNCLLLPQKSTKLSMLSCKYSPSAELTIGFLNIGNKILEFYYNPVKYDEQEIMKIGRLFIDEISYILDQGNLG